MIIKVEAGYLDDFGTGITIDKKFKTFQNISSQQGDVSYQIEIPKTAANCSKLGITSINQITVNNIDCSLLDDSGATVYTGFLRIESVKNSINCTFYSGNSNWIKALNVPIRNSFAWISFDKDTTSANITDSWDNDSGIVWPLVDRGALSTRLCKSLYIEDMQPFMYVKDIVRTILNQSHMKITGDLNNDPVYNRLITTNNGQSGLRQRIDARTIYARKTSTQTLTTTFATLTFTDVSTPYSNSPNSNWDTGTSIYTADTDYRRLKIDINLKMTAKAATFLRVRLNGTTTIFEKTYFGTLFIDTITLDDVIANGSDIEVQMALQQALFLTGNVDTDSTIKITPVKFYKVYADSLLPNVTASQFLSQIFQMFNIVASYEPASKTIRTTKFSAIKNKTPLDISAYLSEIIEINHTEFLSSFSQKNFFVYKEQNAEEITEYNEANDTPYGGGLTELDDQILGNSQEIVSLDFIAPYQRYLPSFSMSLPSLAMCETSETEDTVTITSVTDNGDGYARFNFSGTNPFTANQLVRVSGSAVDGYNGDFRIIANNASSLILEDVAFSATATPTVTGLEVVDVINESQVCLINVLDQDVNDITGDNQINFESANQSRIGFAYFFLVNQNLPINTTAKHALYFDPPANEPAAYQIGLREHYRDIERIAADPVLVRATFLFPLTVFNDINDVVPLRLATNDFNLVFYPNLIRGYESSSKECEVELIKL